MDSTSSWDAFAPSKDIRHRRLRNQHPSDPGKTDLLIVEDDIESNTVVGTGRSNLLQKVASIEESFKARRLVSKDGDHQHIKTTLSINTSDDSQKPREDTQRRTLSHQWDVAGNVNNVDLQQDMGQSLLHPKVDQDAATVLPTSPPSRHSKGKDERTGTSVMDAGRPSSTAVVSSSCDPFRGDSDIGYRAASTPKQSTNDDVQPTASIHEERSVPASRGHDRSTSVSVAVSTTSLSPELSAPWMVSEQTEFQPATWSVSPATVANSRPINVQTAVELKKVALGSALHTFPEHWMMQALCFSDVPPMDYGLTCTANELSPLLAAVQAVLLVEMLFGAQSDGGSNDRSRRLRPTKEERVRLLVQCLTRALWRAGCEEQATLVLPCHQNAINGGGRYKVDGVTEQLVLLSFDSREELFAAVQTHIDVFLQEGRGSLVVLLYSLILSRGINKVADDIKDMCGSLLVGDRATCSQNVVALVTVGCASLDDIAIRPTGLSGGPARPARSVSSRFDVGFLALDEHYRRCHVGTRLKTPRYPVWIVDVNGHYGVLFSPKHELVSDWKAERRFDLYFYDVAARQDYEIRLTIDTTGHSGSASNGDDTEEGTPPLELCISTKSAALLLRSTGKTRDHWLGGFDTATSRPYKV